MFRVLVCLLLVAGAGCGSPPKTVKHAKKEVKHDARALLSEAREDAKAGEYDAADKAYAEAYDSAKDFDILEERIDFLVHAGRAGKAVEAAKTYYDANVADTKGWALY